MSKHDIGLIGLAVMGQNLVMNMANKGFSVGVYNRTTETTHEFLKGLASRPAGVVEAGAAERIHGYDSLEDFVNSLAAPRRVMIMVKAGSPVDAVIDQLKPLLAKGDIIIDGGNADYTDTNRRHKQLAEEGFRFIGTGVSGGEEGALKGPSIMPGGHPEAWPFVKEIFQKISAKVGPNNDIPCCEWVGEAGAGQYVKMVHNGIEYGDMQLICEAYQLMKDGLGMSADEMHRVFDDWNKGDLDSFLIEITADAKPPVVRIVDLNKWIYNLRRAKKEQDRKARENATIVKEIQLRPVTDKHDIEVKQGHAKEFLADSAKVKVVIKFRGRELAFAQKGFELMETFISGIGPCKIEKAPEMNGRMLMAILAPQSKKA